MNVYDFDGTIYKGDSTADFYLFLIRRHPGLMSGLPAFAAAAVKKKLGKIDLTQMKDQFYTFIPRVRSMDGELALFWETHMKNIMAWYLLQRRPDDVIISASPEFLLRIPAERLGWERLIASPVDPVTGRYQGVNCKGEEKVRRFREHYPDGHIDGFYSDSWSDLPLAKLADSAYLIKHETVCTWDTKAKHR